MFLVFRTADFQEMRAVMVHKEPSNSQVSVGLKSGTWHFRWHGLGSVLGLTRWCEDEDGAQWLEGLLSMLGA